METAEKINLDQLEKQYGKQLRKYIEFDIKDAVERKRDWKLETVSESNYFITFAFATESFASVYEVSKKRKVVDDKYLIGSVEGRKIIDLMSSLQN